MGVARQFIPVFGGTDEWPASFPLTAQSITRSAVGETDMVDDPKRKPRQGDVDRDTGERRRQEDALDEALKNTFPASDPVSVEQPTTSGRASRSCRERPRRGCAAEQRDELAAPCMSGKEHCGG